MNDDCLYEYSQNDYIYGPTARYKMRTETKHLTFGLYVYFPQPYLIRSSHSNRLVDETEIESTTTFILRRLEVCDSWDMRTAVKSV